MSTGYGDLGYGSSQPIGYAEALLGYYQSVWGLTRDQAIAKMISVGVDVSSLGGTTTAPTTTTVPSTTTPTTQPLTPDIPSYCQPIAPPTVAPYVPSSPTTVGYGDVGYGTLSGYGEITPVVTEPVIPPTTLPTQPLILPPTTVVYEPPPTYTAPTAITYPELTAGYGDYGGYVPPPLPETPTTPTYTPPPAPTISPLPLSEPGYGDYGGYAPLPLEPPIVLPPVTEPLPETQPKPTCPPGYEPIVQQLREQIGELLVEVGVLQGQLQQKIGSEFTQADSDRWDIVRPLEELLDKRLDEIITQSAEVQKPIQINVGQDVSSLKSICECIGYGGPVDQQPPELPEGPPTEGEPPTTGEPPEEKPPEECPICPEPEPEPEFSCPSGFIAQLDTAGNRYCSPESSEITECPPGFIRLEDPYTTEGFRCIPYSQPPYIPPETPEEPLPEEPKEPEKPKPPRPGPRPRIEPIAPILVTGPCGVESWNPGEGTGWFQANAANTVLGNVADILWTYAETGDANFFARGASGGVSLILSGLDEAIKLVLGGFLSAANVPAECQGGWLSRLLLGFIKKWVSDDIDYLLLPLAYATNKCTPFKYPSAGEAAAAFIHGRIDETTLKSWVEINGVCWSPYERIVNAMQTKLTAFETMVAHRRGFIDESEYRDKIRQLGYLEDGIDDLIKNLGKEIPPVTELIRYMVRDVADVNLVQKFGMDDAFENKWTAKVKEWSEQQGVGEDYARASWRAHWTIPSPTQLFEMFHRLRRKPNTDQTAIDLETIRSALQQQDVLPFWIPKLLAISFNPLTRVDVRRMYEVGALQRDEVEQAYTEIGYSDQNAQRLTNFTERLRNLSLYENRYIKLWLKEGITRSQARERMIANGVPAADVDRTLHEVALQQRNHRIVKLYEQQKIPRHVAATLFDALGYQQDEFTRFLDDAEFKFISHPVIEAWLDYTISRLRGEELLRQWGYKESTIVQLFSRAESRLQRESLTACITALRRRARLGEFTRDELNRRLGQMSLDAEQIARITAETECIRSAVGKQPPTNTLCKWLERGAIGEIEFVRRLQNIGWSEEDSIRILGDCLAKISIARRREAEKIARQDSQARQRQLREERRLSSQIARDSAALEKRQQARQAATQKREKQILKAADSLADRLGFDLAETVSVFRASKQQVQRDKDLSVDEAIQAVVLASEDWTDPFLTNFYTAVAVKGDAILEAVIAAANGQA